ncbi:hypothetical protein RW1_059_00080 [Rhodococcus wratislaviensis NBRC 100605]|uniref:Uncharacterized protein n=1 Tax=Rhodococcus wratislaviensis NBRC 100605 TaxID=1219028 RepID=X0PYQ9_RHOWR|nr:hypothetical protein RW1_059_00080 [Rhodococcus wratislaviensis NBRC 100605]
MQLPPAMWGLNKTLSRVLRFTAGIERLRREYIECGARQRPRPQCRDECSLVDHVPRETSTTRAPPGSAASSVADISPRVCSVSDGGPRAHVDEVHADPGC